MSSTSSTRSSLRLLSSCALLALLAGCAAAVTRAPLTDTRELTETPFFPQTEHACGPAALATVLNAADVAASPAELIDAVYIDGLEGSLQAELHAATRRHGLLPVPIPPHPEALLDEIASGRPVLILQNLGLKIAPRWHYAVVIGYDAASERFILRSGTERRRLERAQRFLRRWELADHWGFVVAQPGRIPATATADTYMRALVDTERELEAEAARAAYAAAVARWPDDSSVLFLAGVRAHADEALPAAARLYRGALARAPGHVPARNNLAELLLTRGCRDEALGEAREALRREGPDGPFLAAVADTVDRIEASVPSASEPAYCAAY